MGENTKMKRALALLLILMVVISCTKIDSFLATDIKKLKANPREYTDKEIKISGKVSSRFSFLMFKSFTVYDGTDSITVISNKLLPAIGADVTAKGILDEVFSFGDIQGLVLIESDAVSEKNRDK
jgi:hypothetical protein